jgi:hypothetical protein
LEDIANQCEAPQLITRGRFANSPFEYSVSLDPESNKRMGFEATQEQAGFGATWDLGSYDRIEGNTVFLENGEFCQAANNGAGAPRRSTITFVEDCSVDEYIVECVNESPTCVYEMAVRGLCCD